MAYIFDPESRKITLPAGDTLDIRVKIKSGEYDAALFAVYDRKTGADVVSVPVEIDGNETHIRLANRHTRDVPAGNYKWNIRLVSDAEYGEDGKIIVNDDSDDVLTVFGPDNDSIPNFVIRRNGANV